MSKITVFRIYALNYRLEIGVYKIFDRLIIESNAWPRLSSVFHILQARAEIEAFLSRFFILSKNVGYIRVSIRLLKYLYGFITG